MAAWSQHSPGHSDRQMTCGAVETVPYNLKCNHLHNLQGLWSEPTIWYSPSLHLKERQVVRETAWHRTHPRDAAARLQEGQGEENWGCLLQSTASFWDCKQKSHQLEHTIKQNFFIPKEDYLHLTTHLSIRKTLICFKVGRWAEDLQIPSKLRGCYLSVLCSCTLSQKELSEVSNQMFSFRTRHQLISLWISLLQTKGKYSLSRLLILVIWLSHEDLIAVNLAYIIIIDFGKNDSKAMT